MPSEGKVIPPSSCGLVNGASPALEYPRQALSQPAVDLILEEARSCSRWLDEAVDDSVLRRLQQLTFAGPTSMNGQPARLIFVKSPQAKQKLEACLAPGNLGKVATSPVTVIIGYSLQFFHELPRLYPLRDLSRFYSDPTRIEEDAFRNGSLQGAYLVIAARALGLDCGPMSGFDRGRVDAAFFAGTAVKANFLCSLGYADRSKPRPRLPRLNFEETSAIL